MKNFIKAILVVFPWFLKRPLLQLFFGYKLHSSAKIGFSWIYPDHLIMNENSKIGHLNVAIHLNKIHFMIGAKIGRGNWITGFSLKGNSKHFSHQTNRKPELILGEESAITKNHHFDCTHQILIGKFTTIAGYRSQFLTHSINIEMNRQDSLPITIGNYCFVGTNVVVVGGSELPSFSVLGAKSLLNKVLEKEYFLYGGVPATQIKEIDKEAKYFLRTEGFVN
jgi:acetyltransferase-like isoleucine patch superfamily enzyme